VLSAAESVCVGGMKGGALCRKNSNVFAQFDQKQLAELKEAFSFIDANGDGIVDRKDLRDVWATLGIQVHVECPSLYAFCLHILPLCSRE
jgi:hypothetical protein